MILALIYAFLNRQHKISHIPGSPVQPCISYNTYMEFETSNLVPRITHTNTGPWDIPAYPSEMCVTTPVEAFTTGLVRSSVLAMISHSVVSKELFECIDPPIFSSSTKESVTNPINKQN